MITREHVLTTNHWLERFRDTWTTNPPIRLHTRELDMGGNPEWHPDFGHWLDGTAGRHEGTEDRARLKRAMKRLRERSLRESEVLHRILVLGWSIPEITGWLNVRSAVAGRVERYSDRDTMVIVYAAVDKISEWY